MNQFEAIWRTEKLRELSEVFAVAKFNLSKKPKDPTFFRYILFTKLTTCESVELKRNGPAKGTKVLKTNEGNVSTVTLVDMVKCLSTQ